MTKNHVLPGQSGDDVLGETVRKVFLFRVAAHILNGRTAIDGLSGSGSGGAAGPPPLDANAIDPHRPRDVLELALAGILKATSSLPCTSSCTRPDTQMPPGSRQRLQSRRHVHAVAPHVVAIDDDVAEVDADAELDPLLRRNVGIALGHAALDLDRAAHP